MPHPISIAYPAGKRTVEAHWSNGILAVTPHVGSIFPSGDGLDERPGEWTVTHIRTGYALSGLIPGATSKDADIMAAFAEALTPAASWHLLDVEQAMSDERIRSNIVEAARAFWASREGEG
jgi:hypothetical protein